MRKQDDGSVIVVLDGLAEGSWRFDYLARSALIALLLMPLTSKTPNLAGRHDSCRSSPQFPTLSSHPFFYCSFQAASSSGTTVHQDDARLISKLHVYHTTVRYPCITELPGVRVCTGLL